MVDSASVGAMSNTVVSLSVPTSNASGAAVDVSGMGKDKTITVGGVFDGAVNIQYATDEAGTEFATLQTFHGPGNYTTSVACRWLRAKMTGYRSGEAIANAMGSNAGAMFVELPDNGDPVDISELPLFKTVVVNSEFTGNIEFSLDGDTWQQAFLTFEEGSSKGQSEAFYGALARIAGKGAGGVWLAAANPDTGNSIFLSDGIVFRPYSLLPSHENVLVTWDEVIAVLAATADDGFRTVYFDFVNSPNRDPLNSSQLTWEMPGGTLGDVEGVYDFKNVKWDNIQSSVETPLEFWGSFYASNGMSMSFADDVHIVNLAHIHGNNFLLYNTSSVNIPITITPDNSTLYLDGTLSFGNNAITFDDSTPNPDAQPVITSVGFSFDIPFPPDGPGFTAAKIWTDSAQVLLGVFGTGESNGEGDSIAPMNPVVDFGGGVWFLRVNWQANGLTSSKPAFLIVERVFGNEGVGQMNEQPWTFLVNPENMSFELTPGTRVTYWMDYSSDRFDDPNARNAPLAASFYTDPDRSGNYSPRSADPETGMPFATQYNCQHNQLCLSDPTPVGVTGLVIQLPTATYSSGEVVIVKDTVGTASPAPILDTSAPITIKVEDGVSGTGDSITATVPLNGTFVLADAAALFDALMVGQYVVITGATNPANNGTFPVIEFIDATSIRYINKLGVAEVSGFSWSVSELILGEVVGGAQSTTISSAFGSKTFMSNGIGGWTVI